MCLIRYTTPKTHWAYEDTKTPECLAAKDWEEGQGLSSSPGWHLVSKVSLLSHS